MTRNTLFRLANNIGAPPQSADLEATSGAQSPGRAQPEASSSSATPSGASSTQEQPATTSTSTASTSTSTASTDTAPADSAAPAAASEDGAAAAPEDGTAAGTSAAGSAPDWSSFPAGEPQYPEAAKAAFDPDGDGTYTVGRPTAGGQGAGTIPAGLEAFYNQKVTWGSCEPFLGTSAEHDSESGVMSETRSYYWPAKRMECGYVIVPVDYSKPDGATMAVAVVRVPSPDLSDAPAPFNSITTTPKGPLFVNPGGPGQDAVKYASVFFNPYFEAENGTVDPEFLNNLLGYDIVGVAPRGTQFSFPNIVCESVEANQAYEAADLTAEESRAFNVWRAQQCATNSVKHVDGIDGNDFLNHAGMDGTARDMDVVRSILGAEKLNYYGVSYGSKLGYQYASLFPDNIKNYVIDSSENQFQNNLKELAPYAEVDYVPTSPLQRGLQQGIAIETTFRNFLRSCLEGGKGAAFGTSFSIRVCPLVDGMPTITAGHTATDEEIQAAYEAFQELTRKAVDNPHYFHADDPDRPVNFDDLIQGVQWAMYRQDRWYKLSSAIQILVRDANAQPLLTMADDYYGRTWNASTNEYEYGAASHIPGRFETLMCLDTTNEGYSANLTQTEIATLYHNAAPWTWSGKEATEGNPSGDSVPSYCALFNDSAKLAPGTELASLPPVLVAGGTWDFATPFWNSVITADAMNGYLLISAQSSHGAYNGDNQCATNIINHYYTVGAAQFDADFKAGKLNDPMFTGASGVRTKNMKSEEIIGTECQLYSFRNGDLGVAPPADTEEPATPDTPATPDPTQPTVEPTQPSAPAAPTSQEPSASTTATTAPGTSAGGRGGVVGHPSGKATAKPQALARTGAAIGLFLTLSATLIGTGAVMLRSRRQSLTE